MEFFSARLLFVSLIDDRKSRKRNLYDESVIVFRAKDLDHAFQRANQIGLTREHSYDSVRGEKVRWAFVNIVNLDWVGPKVDGKEVASKLHYRISKKPIPFRTRFRPERSKPEGSF